MTRLPAALAILLLVCAGCAKRTYTVTVTDAAAARVARPAARPQNLDRLRRSAERLRDIAKAEPEPEASQRSSLGVVGGDSDTVRGTSGAERDAGAAPPEQVNGAQPNVASGPPSGGQPRGAFADGDDGLIGTMALAVGIVMLALAGGIIGWRRWHGTVKD